MIKKIQKKGFIIKKSMTFRIDEELVKAFNEAVKKTGIKKTFVIEECLRKYVRKVDKNVKDR
jgi:predicted transcriptional regulator